MKWLNQSLQALPYGMKCKGHAPKFSSPVTQKPGCGVVTVLEDEFQSLPSPIIHYTYNDTLEGLGCCEMAELIQTYSILV